MAYPVRTQPRCLAMPLAALFLALAPAWAGAGEAADGAVVKQLLRASATGADLLNPDAWGDYEQGAARDGAEIVCDNAGDSGGRRGARQTVVLNQTEPEPIIASVESRCEGVSGSPGRITRSTSTWFMPTARRSGASPPRSTPARTVGSGGRW